MIDILKTSTTVKPGEGENEYVVKQEATIKVEDEVTLSEAAQTVVEVQSAIEKYEDASGISSSITPNEAAVNFVEEHLGRKRPGR